MDLSELDQPLLNALHDNGRLSFSALGRLLDVPRHRVERRVHELLLSDNLQIAAQVHPAILGLHVYCHLLIQVESSTAAVIKGLESLPEVSLISAISGDHDVAVELGAHDSRHLQDVLQSLRGLPGVRCAVASQHIEILKSRFNAETLLTSTAPRLDARDHQLIELLRRDGRMPYGELAAEIGISPASARVRVHQLIDSGALRITAVTSRRDAARSILMGVGLNFNGNPAPLANTVRQMTAVEFAATTIGRFDAILTMSGRSLRSLNDHLEELRGTKGVGNIVSWVHLEVARESYE